MLPTGPWLLRESSGLPLGLAHRVAAAEGDLEFGIDPMPQGGDEELFGLANRMASKTWLTWQDAKPWQMA